jgi:hypothetical protein
MPTPLLPLIGGEAFRDIKTEFEKHMDEFYYDIIPNNGQDVMLLLALIITFPCV